MADVLDMTGRILVHTGGAVVALSIIWIGIYGVCLVIDKISGAYLRHKTKRRR